MCHCRGDVDRCPDIGGRPGRTSGIDGEGLMTMTMTTSKKRRISWAAGLLGVVAALAPGAAVAQPDGGPSGGGASATGSIYLGESYVSSAGNSSDAWLKLVVDGSGLEGAYFARFYAVGERLLLQDRWADGRRLEAEVRVYRHADADGNPYDRIDVDRFFVGSLDVKQLGTPDGTGDIAEGRWIALRIRPEGLSWSGWVYGRA